MTAYTTDTGTARPCYCTGACAVLGRCPCTIGSESLPVIPRLPGPATDGAVAICGECGLRIMPVMGRVCLHMRCPVFLKATC